MFCKGLLIFYVVISVTTSQSSPKCGDPCPIPPRIDPGLTQVCGSNGETYITREALECEKLCNPDLNFVREGECPKERTCGGPCFVSTVYIPLCGTDGKTYQNLDYIKCQFLCDSKLKIEHHGECQKYEAKCGPPCKASKTQNLICGSDGKVYKNLDYFNCQKSCDPGLKIKHGGPCRKTKTNKKCGDPCYVKSTYKPICATNLKTYQNLDLFKCQKLCDPGLEILHRGICKKLQHKCGEPCPSTKGFNPVCALNGKTYSNYEMFLCQKSCDPDLQIKHKGECKQTTGNQSCGSPCRVSTNLSPVCATDGRSYRNMDWLKCQQRCDQALQVLYHGECKPGGLKCGDPCLASPDYTPVCGTDGKTYHNEDALLCQKICDPDLNVSHAEECLLSVDSSS